MEIIIRKISRKKKVTILFFKSEIIKLGNEIIIFLNLSLKCARMTIR
jgi:hypothetical protein